MLISNASQTNTGYSPNKKIEDADSVRTFYLSTTLLLSTIYYFIYLDYYLI